MYILTLILVLLSSSVSLAANCGGGTACNCNDTVTTNYTLNSTLDCSGVNQKNNPGLNVGSNVTLTCTPGIGIILGGRVASVHGIKIEGRSSVTVKGCRVESFDRGIYIADSNTVTVSGVISKFNLSYGADVRDTATSPDTYNVMIDNGTFGNNDDEGIHLSGRVGGPVPNYTVQGAAVTENVGEGIYILNVNGTSTAWGATIQRNVIFGNGIGMFIDTSDYVTSLFNSFTFDNVGLRLATHVTLTDTIITYARMKLELDSDNNTLKRLCIEGNLIFPADSFVIDDSHNNTCDKCVLSEPSDYHVRATNSSSVTFTGLRIDPGMLEPNISKDAGSTVTWSPINLNKLPCQQ